MMQDIQTPLTIFAAFGSGLMAGTFFAFSVFVIGALARSQGIAAMNSINVVVLNAVFLGVFLGTTVVCVPRWPWNRCGLGRSLVPVGGCQGAQK
jgi:uncharacterized membrane protein